MTAASGVPRSPAEAMTVFRVDGGEDRRTDDGSGRHAEEGQGADDAQRTRPHRAPEQVRGDRRPDRDEHAAADRLDEPRGDELVHRLGGPGQRGPDDEHDERAQEQPSRAPQVGEAARPWASSGCRPAGSR